MHTFIKMLASCFLLSGFLTYQAEAIQLNLTGKDIEEAFEYGTKGRDLSHAELLSAWRVNLGEGVGSASIVTPFGRIVVLGKEMADRLRDPNEREIKEALDENKGKLVFGCTLYGDDTLFADQYKAVLMYKDKKIEPSKKKVPSSGDFTRFYPDSPRFRALCFYIFDVGKIDPNAKVILILKNGDGEELKFPFDLSKLR